MDIDTNLLLDLVLNREGAAIAKKIFLKAQANNDNVFITASAVTDLFYIIHRSLHDNEKTYEVMSDIFCLVNIIAVTEIDIMSAFFAKWKDFEDCVQFMAAENHGISYIITRNIKDFAGRKNVILPEDYLTDNFSA